MSLLYLEKRGNAKIALFICRVNGLPEFNQLLLDFVSIGRAIAVEEMKFCTMQKNCAARAVRWALIRCVAERKR